MCREKIVGTEKFNLFKLVFTDSVRAFTKKIGIFTKVETYFTSLNACFIK